MAAPVAIVLVEPVGAPRDGATPLLARNLCGRPVLAYPIVAAREAGAARVLVTADPAALRLPEEWVARAEWLGEGDPWATLLEALTSLPEGQSLLLLRGDAPLVTGEDLRCLLATHTASGQPLTALASNRDHGAGGNLSDPSSALGWALDLGSFRIAVNPRAVRRIDQLWRRLANGCAIPMASTAAQHDGVLTEENFPAAALVLWEQMRGKLSQAGVILLDSQQTYVDVDVEVAPGTVLYPHTYLQGRTVIGREAEIGPSVRLINTRVGDRTQIQFSVSADAEIGSDCRIGPFAHLRPGCRLGRGVKVGNFVELKNAVVEDGVSISHLSYIGDAFVGERTNIGAGTITCNYDGQKKHPTRIGRRAFIGSHATLIAPVEVGDGAYVAAASPVTEDVPPDALAIARCRQTVKEGWARKRREGE